MLSSKNAHGITLAAALLCLESPIHDNSRHLSGNNGCKILL